MVCVLFGVPLFALLVLAVGSALSLDRSGRYAAAAAALPGVTAGRGPDDGLVRIKAGGLEFRARVRNLHGEGDALIMLHGFPQSSASWQPVLDSAAQQGYRCVAFDLRGFSPGARPVGVTHYSIDRLVGDVLAVADALGIERFHLAGHDWGAATGWGVVMSRPERVISWTALSIAHSMAFLEAVRNDPDQRRRSAYILLFRLPWLPEALLAWGRHLLLRRLMYRWMPKPQEREYLALFAEPGALTSVLNYYRAMGKGPGIHAQPEIALPVLFIWGNRDPAAGRSAVEAQSRFMRGDYRFLELDAGHWLLERRGDVVASAILEHLAAHAEQPRA